MCAVIGRHTAGKEEQDVAEDAEDGQRDEADSKAFGKATGAHGSTSPTQLAKPGCFGGGHLGRMGLIKPQSCDVVHSILMINPVSLCGRWLVFLVNLLLSLLHLSSHCMGNIHDT